MAADLQEAAMRGRSRSRYIAVAWCGLLVGLGPGGCASPPPPTPVAERPTLNAETRAADDEAATEAEQRADRAARDVDTVLDMRRQRQAILDEIPSLPGFEDPVAAPAKPGAIQWNDTGIAGVVGDPAPAPARTPQPTSPPPLAKDAPPPITIEPLDAVAPPALADEEPGGGAVETPATNAATVLEAAELRSLLVDVRRELNLQKPWSNQPLRELLAMAMLTLIDPEMEINPEAFVDVTESERAIVASFQEFCIDLRERLDGSVEAEEAIAEAVLELRRALVREPELHLPTVALCWRVGGFGDYDEFDRAAFLAHAEQQFILYLEIDSFTSELNKKGQWVTEVSQQWEIYHAEDGIPVWSEPWQKAVDVTNKERRDFFTTQIVTVPKALSVGSYLFKIRVRDEKSGAEVEHSVAMEVVADPKLAVAVPD
jgi:hypothetical protein